MTIKKGEDWGCRAPLPDGTPLVSTDSGLAALFAIDERSGIDPVVVGPSHVGLCASSNPTTRPIQATNNLARTVSAHAQPDELRTGERTHLPLDLAIVTIDGIRRVVASSVVLRRPFWSGVTEGAMNSSFLGKWNVAPSGHPNDGRLDVIKAELSPGDRWKARQKLPSGSHIPHPNITIRRLKSGRFAPESRSIVWLDGVRVGAAEEVEFVVVADATTIVI